jgi:4-amino-4-deoxy-L-arabinose transferase-like glycosyltransferase
MILPKARCLRQRWFKLLRKEHRRAEDYSLIGLSIVIGLLGLTLRIALVWLASYHPVSALSGTGDQVRYLTLAESLSQGNGFTYAGQPTALRPPMYPMLLAVSHAVFGTHYFLAVRLLQFLIGIALVYVCLLLASSLFDFEAGAMAGAIALVFPTLIFISTELQTEGLAAFLCILFLFYFIREIRGDHNGAVGMGVTSGLAMILRYNCAILPILGAIACLWFRRSPKHSLTVLFLAGLIVFPWIARNAIVFKGKILFSSHGGINLLEGVLAPDGRAQNGENAQVRAAGGWSHTDIEVNSAHRLLFPSEDRLDTQARVAAFAAWSSLSLKSCLRLLGGKIVRFWLSTDQLLDTASFSPRQRRLRIAGVVGYWFVLVLALVGWLSLFSTSRNVALAIAFYAVFVTAAHLPFVMNTRLRIPFLDPLSAVLAAGGFSILIRRCQVRVTHD